jgi:iron complex transport system substrate-binding protein
MSSEVDWLRDSPLGDLLGAAPPYPRRVVCLTEETTEILYRLGAGDLVVGVSGFTVRPREARQKPKVSSFLDANFDRILELKPDLVLGFSDLQADLGRELCRRCIPVVLFNQRSVAEILQTVRLVGSLVGLSREAEVLAQGFADNLVQTAERARGLPRHPRVFFEEWHEPLISGIRWVSELVEIAGGQDVCPETRGSALAKGRIFDPAEIARRNPDLVIASWCGRKARRDQIVSRPGWDRVRAVADDQLYEVKSSFILQPGPAALTDGLAQLAAIVEAWALGRELPVRREGELRQAPW